MESGAAENEKRGRGRPRGTGTVSSTPGTRTPHIDVPMSQDLRDWLQQQADQAGEKLGAYVREVLEEYRRDSTG